MDYLTDYDCRELVRNILRDISFIEPEDRTKLEQNFARQAFKLAAPSCKMEEWLDVVRKEQRVQP